MNQNPWFLGPAKLSVWQRLSPAQLFVGSFLLLVALGTLALRVLPGLYRAERLDWLDALFTATSAVCVTGLIVVDTATYFTPAGQAVVLALIQLGGLGIITFTTLIILALGRRLSLRHEALASTHEVAPEVDRKRLARDVVVFTFAIEAAGALALFGLWLPRFGLRDAAWHSVFHSISAFCNAGFSTFSDSLIGFARAPATLGVMATLIILGGLGFLTLEELYLRRKALERGRSFRFSVHSRLVLTVTAVLLLGGWILYASYEWNVALDGLPVWGKLLNSGFMSVTVRTAGFNTVDYAGIAASSAFLTILLMMIGGSPGSTAGGLKTTTTALIALLAWSRFRGRSVVSIWYRSIPEETIQRAVGLFVVAFGIVTAAIFAYTASEVAAAGNTTQNFLLYMFEAASAFNTVGLSMGVTAALSTAGKWITILLMFIGRVGPLTFAAAVALDQPTPAGEFRYAYTDVVVG